ncbi:MAG: polysaccharide deacetylase [Lachnospiraceae bacterium]|jgi:peptidoglycan/xylan/chitin deacetylase (PgdA/CDA1 family)|nr:polysaccharide deacetylase [Lachnospiraceae bacterium]
MGKITRAELARRRRVNLYKKIIVYGLMIMLVSPILTSLFLINKVASLEKRLDYVVSKEGGDYMTYRSSHDALINNPHVEGKILKQQVRSVLGNTEMSINQAENTAESAVEDAVNVTENSTEIANVDEVVETSAKAGADNDSQVEQTKRVYLTFDDGPSIYTGQILDVLKANDVKATFFVIGKDEAYYEYYRRIVDEGHTIGMHSYTHEYQKLYESRDSFASEIEQLQQLIENVTGVQSNIFRFPGGSSNSVSQLPIQDYIAYLNEHNINYYDWNALSGDAIDSSLSSDRLVENIMRGVHDNEDSIVLMHDLQTTHATVESLQKLIDTLKSEGYEILPIDENTPLIQHVSCNSVEE